VRIPACRLAGLSHVDSISSCPALSRWLAPLHALPPPDAQAASQGRTGSPEPEGAFPGQLRSCCPSSARPPLREKKRPGWLGGLPWVFQPGRSARCCSSGTTCHVTALGTSAGSGQYTRFMMPSAAAIGASFSRMSSGPAFRRCHPGGFPVVPVRSSRIRPLAAETARQIQPLPARGLPALPTSATPGPNHRRDQCRSRQGIDGQKLRRSEPSPKMAPSAVSIRS
jgi:hypothetical protein